MKRRGRRVDPQASCESPREERVRARQFMREEGLNKRGECQERRDQERIGNFDGKLDLLKF